jgi:hypothetical protein
VVVVHAGTARRIRHASDDGFAGPDGSALMRFTSRDSSQCGVRAQ